MNFVETHTSAHWDASLQARQSPFLGAPSLYGVLASHASLPAGSPWGVPSSALVSALLGVALGDGR